jgi:hypothetical protein
VVGFVSYLIFLSRLLYSPHNHHHHHPPPTPPSPETCRLRASPRPSRLSRLSRFSRFSKPRPSGICLFFKLKKPDISHSGLHPGLAELPPVLQLLSSWREGFWPDIVGFFLDFFFWMRRLIKNNYAVYGEFPIDSPVCVCSPPHRIQYSITQHTISKYPYFFPA